MEYKSYDCNSYTIQTIKTNKFKTIRIEIIFNRIAKKEETPFFVFLSDLLTESSSKYKSRKEVVIRLEELYKAAFYATTNKIGNMLTISFVIEFIDPRYLNDKNYLEEVVSLPFEFLNNPDIENKEFKITNFNIVKRRLIQEIDSIKENSSRLALIKALNKMDSKSITSARLLGTKQDIAKITPQNLFHTYEDLFNHSNCDIFVIGNINMAKIVNIIKNKFQNKVIKLSKPSLIVNNKTRSKVLKVSSSSTFIQSTLVMIYNICNLTKKEKDISFPLFNYILGSGGISSKLYQKLRIDNSLCYSVRSLYLKYDGLLIIQVSLDEENVKKAEKLIKKAIMEMKKGEYEDKEIKNAQKNIEFSLKMNLDNNISILDNYVFHYFDNIPLTNERIELLNKISKEDLLKCAKSLKLNTIYIQNAGEQNERN